jgi:hypothetical protein
VPKKTKAMNIPTIMLKKLSHKRENPNRAAAPPNPMMTVVPMKVAPYDRTITPGCIPRPAII